MQLWTHGTGSLNFFFVFFFSFWNRARQMRRQVCDSASRPSFFFTELPSFRSVFIFIFETKMTRPLFGNGIFDGFRTRFETVYFETLFFCFSMEHFLLQNAKENICEHETCYSLS